MKTTKTKTKTKAKSKIKKKTGLTLFQQKWVDALRSGKYKQGKDYLAYKCKDTGEFKYCCLGVACEVALEEGVLSKKDVAGSEVLSYYGSDKAAPEAVTKALDLRGDCGDLVDGRMLTEMNDSGASFKKIANLIEQHPEQVFKAEKR